MVKDVTSMQTNALQYATFPKNANASYTHFNCFQHVIWSPDDKLLTITIQQCCYYLVALSAKKYSLKMKYKMLDQKIRRNMQLFGQQTYKSKNDQKPRPRYYVITSTPNRETLTCALHCFHHIITKTTRTYVLLHPFIWNESGTNLKQTNMKRGNWPVRYTFG